MTKHEIYKGGEFYIGDEYVGKVTEFNMASKPIDTIFSEQHRGYIDIVGITNMNYTFTVKLRFTIKDRVRKFFGLKTKLDRLLDWRQKE